MPDTPANPIFTIGHSTRSVAALIALLREAGVERLVDVRSVPRSRVNPQFNADALPGPLAASGIRYAHLKALGGLRHHPKGAPPSPNTLWRSGAFRNYADYAMSAAFRAGLDELCSPATNAARSCAPRRCGGAVTAASSPTTCWRGALP
jgi:uncharacterized protein (DUF488 family)